MECNGVFEGPLEGRERAATWNLWRVRGVRFPHIVRLEQRLDDDVGTLWERNADDIERVLAECEFGSSATETILEMANADGSFEARYRRERKRIPERAQIVHVRDRQYPERLLALEEPPVFLYAYGALGACRRDHSIAVVGSRDAPVRDVRRARRIVGALGEADLTVVSGGALGIDRAAHEAAMDVDGETVVVLPAGLDQPSPSSNRDVFERAVDCGAVVTEYPLGVGVRRYHFPRRNRLIAALGDATFVVRAGPESGTMLTADAAADLDRPICALVGDVDEALAEGCLELIVDGAQAVRNADDILEHQYPDLAGKGNTASSTSADSAGSPTQTVDPDALSDDATTLLKSVRGSDCSSSEVVHADEIAELLDWSTGRLQTALLELELHGVCEKAGGAFAYRFATGQGRR